MPGTQYMFNKHWVFSVCVHVFAGAAPLHVHSESRGEGGCPARPLSPTLLRQSLLPRPEQHFSWAGGWVSSRVCLSLSIAPLASHTKSWSCTGMQLLQGFQGSRPRFSSRIASTTTTELSAKSGFSFFCVCVCACVNTLTLLLLHAYPLADEIHGLRQ